MRARIGFISTRLEGTDGVSLEAAKWLQVLTGLGHDCCCFCGASDWPEDKVHLVPEAHFLHPEISQINRELFNEKKRNPDTTRFVFDFKEHLKRELQAFVEGFGVELLVVENAVSLPMNVPLGLALTEFVGETSIPFIAHHHDFWWERTRYASSPAEDWLRAAFPPVFQSVEHVVINSVAARELAFRKGVGSILIPNVMDFERPPSLPGSYTDDLKRKFDIDPDEFLILQPTRVVPRKRIERAIELLRYLEERCVLLVTHDTGDEDADDYADYLRRFADVLQVRLILAPERFGHRRGRTTEGRKVYSIADAYQNAALVTYPSLIEGFGNAFLETVYYKRPLFMGAYEIFQGDILPRGFRVIAFQDFIDSQSVRAVRRILRDPSVAAEWTEENYSLARRHYSYETLAKRLESLIGQCLGFRR
jgi:glycosyltransferase involved in cell wall biosynthesis